MLVETIEVMEWHEILVMRNERRWQGRRKQAGLGVARLDLEWTLELLPASHLGLGNGHAQPRTRSELRSFRLALDHRLIQWPDRAGRRVG